MKIVLQRVKNASVRVDGKIKGKIKKGLCLFVGIEKKDIEKDAEYLSKKIVELRIFPDETGKMNLSLSKVGGVFWSSLNLLWLDLSGKEEGRALKELKSQKKRKNFLIISLGCFKPRD